MSKLPQVNGGRLINALKKKGWYVDRTSGSHAIMRDEGRAGAMVVVPVHTKPLKPGTLDHILKAAGLSGEEIRELL
jgi:predicted RNA binding protein YcfA (HicA-like mRNA interferase family)